MTVESAPAQVNIRTKARREVWGYLQPASSSESIDESVLDFNSEKALGILRNGISSRVIDPLAEFFGMGKGQIVEYLGLNRTTVLRRAIKDQPLPTHAAESMLRLLELNEIASYTFGTEEAAQRWLSRAHPMLDGESPMQMARTSFGVYRVKDILIAIKYGGVV